MKHCPKCNTTKAYSEFNKKTAARDGLASSCRACNKQYYADNKQYFSDKWQQYYAEHKEHLKAKRKVYGKIHKEQESEYRRKYHALHRDKGLEQSRGFRLNNPEYFKQYRRINRSKMHANTRKRQADKINRTPTWLNIVSRVEIECIYVYATALNQIGLQYHVDHILPLKGYNVSGLHVPENLQVIPAVENMRKGNRYDQTT